MRVVIAGAGSVGRSIARELLGNGHEVLLVDKDPAAIRVASVPGRPVAARRRLRDRLPRRGRARRLRRRRRRDRRRQGQPRRLAAGQDRVRRAAHGRPGEQPEERVDVRRGLGGRRRRLDAAADDRPRRGGRLRRRPGADLHVPAGPRQHGRADPARRLAGRRHPGRRHRAGPPDTVLVGIIRAERPIAPSRDDTLEAQRRADVRDRARERGRAAGAAQPAAG